MADGVRAVPVVILGSGGHGREVLDVVEALPHLRLLGFVDDAPAHPERLSSRGAALLAGLDDPALRGAGYLVGIGDPGARERLSGRAEHHGLVPLSVQHPSATGGADNRIGEGFVVFAQVSYTTNLTIGRHVHLNRASTVGHDCVLGDFVTVNPGANVSGSVELGDGVTVGTGASIIQGVRVGAGTVVGAGSVVTRDLPEGVVAFGAPARPVRPVG